MTHMSLGDTDVIQTVRNIVTGLTAWDSAAFTAFIDERLAALNMANHVGDTPLHVACSAGASEHQYPAATRDALITVLLKKGSNPFLLNDNGETPLTQRCLDDEAEREAMVKLVFDHRSVEEHKVPSMAPLSASRLMKRAKEDKGTGVFSTVVPHCVYYLYKGAVYLWDTVSDVEHIVFQPRDQVSRIANVEQKLNSFYKRKSFVAHGGEDPTFDVNDEDNLAGELKQLETQVSLVQHFTIGTSLKASADIIPAEGVTEWVLCNTGALIGVNLDRNGIKLKEGGGRGSFSRRKSHVCGASASYPEGKQPNIRIMQHCSVRFTKRPSANKICCAIDGLYGQVGYIAATKNSKAVAAAKARPKPNNPFGSPAKPAGSGIRAVTFLSDTAHNLAVSCELQSEDNNSDDDKPKVQVFARTGEISFRVVKFSNMAPKEGFDDCMVDLCNKWDPFSGMDVTEILLKEAPTEEELEKGLIDHVEPVCVQMCGTQFYLAFLTNGVVAIDASCDPPRRITIPSKPEGPVVDGVGMHAQHLKSIRSAAPQFHFAQVSKVIELFQMVTTSRSNPDLPKEFVPILRIPQDRVHPHKFSPLFHPAEDTMVVLYQSNRRQELCAFHLNTRRMQSVCRLPKPSSLRFYQSGLDANGNALAAPPQELADMCFNFSVDGSLLLRYNVSMHVMSIYAWDDVYELMADSTKPYINTTFTREPRAVKKTIKNTAASAPEHNAVQVKGDDCIWMMIECSALKKLQDDAWAEHPEDTQIPQHEIPQIKNVDGEGSGSGSDDYDDGEDEPFGGFGAVRANPAPKPVVSAAGVAARRKRIETMYKKAKEMHSQITSTLRKIVMSHGGRLTTYTPPKHVLADEDDEDDTGSHHPDQSEVDDDDEAILKEDFPLFDTKWYATFFVPLECVRASIKLTRDLLSVHWTPNILGDAQFAPIKLEYRPLTTLERKFKSERVEDTDAATFLQRGPKAKVYLHAGHTNSDPRQMKAAIESYLAAPPVATHVSPQRSRPTSTTPATAAPSTALATISVKASTAAGTNAPALRDGIIAVEGALMKSLKPLQQFFSSTPVVSINTGGATVMVPSELGQRLE